MMVIHGYRFDETQWKTLGGNGQCVTAEKGGRKYFIKRLSKPKYPASKNFTGEFKQAKIRECEQWMAQRQAILKALPGTGTGNIVKPIEYFLEGSSYYEIAYCVDVANIPYTEIWKLSKKDKALLMLTIAKSLSQVHEKGIVHGDLDPGNILISRSPDGNLITKIIDFTDAFFETNPPESIMSKEAWWSPEVALYSKNPEGYRHLISCKADVFSLGLIFHQYCTEGGKFPKHAGDYPWMGFLDNGKLTMDSKIEPEFQELIASMLALEPNDRPTMNVICEKLQPIVRPMRPKPPTPPTPPIVKSAPPKPSAPPTPPVACPYMPGPGKNGKGASVIAVEALSNPKKVKAIFNDGTEQIYDVSNALAQKYIVKPAPPKPSVPPTPPIACPYKPGPGKNGKGASVTAVEALINPKKVRVTFSDGTKQIYDVWNALAEKYIVKT